MEARLGLRESLGLLAWLIEGGSLDVWAVALNYHGGALMLARRGGISANDALACVFIERAGGHEVYSFDRHFDYI